MQSMLQSFNGYLTKYVIKETLWTLFLTNLGKDQRKITGTNGSVMFTVDVWNQDVQNLELCKNWLLECRVFGYRIMQARPFYIKIETV